MILDLTQSLSDNTQYKAWKFPGGELHIKFKAPIIDFLDIIDNNAVFYIKTRLKSSDDIMLLFIVLDTIQKEWKCYINVYMPYMPYQQADRNFGIGECFSLKTITKFLNSYKNVSYCVTDAHSDVTGALLNEVGLVTNYDFIYNILERIDQPEDLVILSPDAGAYKKIFKLCEKLDFQGSIECANKYRDITNGELQVRLSCNDFEGKDILIIDDICMGGRTFVELAKLLKDKNVGKINLAITHGIFSNGFEELSEYFHRIFTTDSWAIMANINIQVNNVKNQNFLVDIYNLY